MRQSEGSLDSGWRPKREALAVSQRQQAVDRVEQASKSMASPCSCWEVPGRAVGGEHWDDGIS